MNTATIILGALTALALSNAYHRNQLHRAELAHQCEIDRAAAKCGTLRNAIRAAGEAADQRNAEINALTIRNEWLELQVSALQAQLNNERASARN